MWFRAGFIIGALFSNLFAVPCEDAPPGEKCTVCTLWETIAPGDTICHDVPGNDEHATETVCHHSEVSERICVEETVFDPKKQSCSSVYEPESGETCDVVARRADIDLRKLKELNTGDICKDTSTRKSICVDGIFDCPETVLPEGKTCQQFLAMREIDKQFLWKFNKDIVCQTDKFQTFYNKIMAELPLCMKDPCSDRHQVGEEDTCETIAKDHSISVAQIKRNNAALSCSNLIIGDNICIIKRGEHVPATAASVSCVLRVLSGTTSCEELATRHSLSLEMFTNNNPDIECSAVEKTSLVCVGDGYFAENQCSDYIINYDVNCTRLLSTSFNKYLSGFKALNPNAQCASDLHRGHLVCVRNSAKTSVLEVVNELKSYSSGLEHAANEFTKDSSSENEQTMMSTLLTDVSKSFFMSRLTNLHKKNSKIRSVLDALVAHVNRTEMCASIQKSKVFANLPHIVKCVCIEKNVMLVCAAQFFAELKKLQDMITPYEKKNLPLTTSAACTLSTSQSNTKPDGCVLPGCKVDFSMFSIHLDSRLCRKPTPADGPVHCQTPTECEQDAIVVNVRICSTHTIFQLSFGGSPCIATTGLYSANLGVLRLNTVLFSNFVKVEARLSFKVHNLLQENICEIPSSRCEDYCAWRKAPTWKMYGVFKTSLDFGYTKLPIIDELVSFPYNLCNSNEVIVKIENHRTEHGQLKVRCWSSDDAYKYIIEETSIAYKKQFEFKVKVFKTTEVGCVVGDSVKKDVAFLVYGGFRGPHGRGRHNFRIKGAAVFYYPDSKDDTERFDTLWN